MSTETTRLGYYPGCELRTRAKALDLSARKACQALGISLEELRDWTCCGSLIPQTKDNYIGLLAPARILLEAHQQGFKELVTLCAFCFNTLRRASFLLDNQAEARRKMETFLGVEPFPRVKVVHLTEVLRDRIGFEAIRKAVRRPLEGLRVAPYYGCLLLRPAREIGLDDPESPTVLEGLLKALGCNVVEFPGKTDCCGSYHVVTNKGIAARCTDLLLHSAKDSQAHLLVTSCPVCQFNLDWRRTAEGNGRVPVAYFPQLLALAIGEAVETLGFSEQVVNALTLARSPR